MGLLLIIFKKIRWKNFLSTGNLFTEIDLSLNQMTCVSGANGSGKSTFLDALTFVLFGKAFRNINKPQLVNSIIRKDLVVELEFSIHDNNYKIIRGIKPTVFEVYVNDDLLNQSSEMKDYQEILEKSILKFNYKSFCQVVILGSASFVPFMQLPAAQRRSIIEDLLDLQIFTTMNVLLKDKVQDNNDLIIDNKNKQAIVEAKIKMSNEHLKEIQFNNEMYIREKNVALLDLKDKRVRSTGLKLHYNDEISIKSNALQALGNIDSLSFRLESMRELRTKMELKVASLSKDVKFFTDNDSCPTCKQKISSEFSCEIVEHRKGEISTVEDGLESLAEKYQKINNELVVLLDIDKECDALRSKVHEESLVIRMLDDRITSIEDEIANISNKTKEISGVRVAELEKELLVISNEYNILQEDRQVLSAASILLKDGGIKTRIVNQYIPIINKMINKYLSEFDLFVEFNLDEQFNEIIRSRHRDEFSYSSFSEGEKQKIDLSILFAWRSIARFRNSLNTNLLILDEVFDSSLDGDSAEDLLKILTSVSEQSNVFVISHRESLHERFENSIKFVKTKSFSRIV